MRFLIKNIAFFFIGVLLVSDIYAQGSCEQIHSSWCPASTYASMPQATYYHAAVWLGDTLYVQAPTATGTYAKTIFKYTYNGVWTNGDSCTHAVVGAAMTACNGKLYLIGGGTTSLTTGTNYVQEYDPVTHVWTDRSPMPANLSGHRAVCWGDSVIFVIGGPWSGSATATNVYYYRPASDTWGTIFSSLPSGGGRRSFAMGIADSNKIVISCGYNTGYLRSTFVGTIGADASQITWTAGADAPVALSRTGGCAVGDFFFVVGGDTNGTGIKNDKVFIYNVPGNAWTFQIPANPHPASNHFSAVTARCINDTVRIFQAGGYSPSSTATSFLDITGCSPGFPIFTVDSIKVTDVSCHGGSDGVVEIFTTGGSGPLEYSLIGGISWAGSHYFGSLPPNSWNVVVRDTFGVVRYWHDNPVVVNEPPAAVSTLNYTSCGTYTLNDSIYPISGTYTQHLTSLSGCDSTLTLNLIVDEPVYAGGDSSGYVCWNIDFYVDLFNFLPGPYIPGGTWSDDDLCGQLSGSTLAVLNLAPSTYYHFTYTVDGGGCPIDQATVTLWTEICMGISGSSAENIRIYPNPVSQRLYLSNIQGCKVEISDLMGRVLIKANAEEELTVIDLSSFVSGVYIVSVQGEGINYVEKVSKF
jgi:hypothetical protein